MPINRRKFDSSLVHFLAKGVTVSSLVMPSLLLGNSWKSVCSVPYEGKRNLLHGLFAAMHRPPPLLRSRRRGD
jgi:hypothetical protein